MRRIKKFKIENNALIKSKILDFFKDEEYFAFLDNNQFNFDNSRLINPDYEFLAGIGSIQNIHSKNQKNSFEELQSHINEQKDWLFGYFSYELKNEIENLHSKNEDHLNFSNLFFFQPKIVISIQNSLLKFEFSDNYHTDKSIENLFKRIEKHTISNVESFPNCTIQKRISRNYYLNTIKKIKQHIQHGDIYEMNFCQEFFIENIELNTLFLYQELNKVSPTPFSCYFKTKNKYLISASPERYLKGIGNKIISQPIKGTIKRGNTKTEDIAFKQKLANSEKDRAENIMIVDLVRNDLSRVAKKSSVKVEELCGIYGYEQVFQMISTISAEKKDKIQFTDIIKATFPMGSMTGAPKIKSMHLIEKYECTKRGLFSGSAGYIDPLQNFDFNVVIRSILYNEINKYLSFTVGGAITSKSNPEEEYEECLLKAKAINKVLRNEN